MSGPSEWPTDASHYALIGKIGQGAFASVWGARTKEESSRDCAVKVLNLDHVDSNLAEIRLEVQAMRLSSHPNVLACHTAFVQKTDLWLVTQIMRKGSSLHSLQSARRRYRDENKGCRMEDHILYIFHETLLGLKYIHDNGQIHRDIKAGNILLDGNGDVRIADFGVSGWLEQAGSKQDRAKTFVGTPCWMAPEVMEQIHGYDYRADIWSLGITALELAKGYAPYAKYPPMKVLILTIQEDPPNLDSYDEEDEGDDALDQLVVDEEWSSSFRSLVDTCLQKNPARRPTTQELLQSKHLNSLNDEAKRDKRREAIRKEVCDLVQDVGTESAESNSANQLPGNTPVSIVLSQQDESRPQGTTWVFADGSQVLASSTNNAATVDDVMNDLDQFGMQTGGEHYARGAEGEEAIDINEECRVKEDDGEEDDLNKFMDDFELNTGGENFKRL
ncbi:Mitogen-activated protein kinase HOG1 (Fragment) [Seminavis robusta]|uniref:Mitogen-activated protein kinase HOG1 n=1 Tax=Seminavis robusta TaxID=568900 RepID=A0A9N8DUJ5_9STRA